MSANSMLNAVRLPTNPSEQSLSLPDVLIRTATCVGVIVVAAVPGWIFLSGAFMLYLGLLIVTMIAGVLLARNAPISAPAALGYSALLGLIVGAFSASAVSYGGYVELIPQAVGATICGTLAMIAVYATPFGRKASKATRFFFALLIGYLLLGVASLLIGVFAGVGNGWGLYGIEGIGLVLCVLGVALASWSLLIDIGQADRAITAGTPESYSWTFGVSLASSIVWLYMEILRFLAIANR